jgi:hypothetical protein
VTGSNETVTQFYGLVDDVAVFDAALTAAELNAWFLSTGGVAESSTRLRTGINFDRETAGSGPRIRPPQSLSGPARIVTVSAQHANGIDAPTLPIVAGTAPIELPFMAGKVFQVGQQFAVRGSHAGQAAFSWDFFWVPDTHLRGSPWTSGLEADTVIFIAGAEGTVIRSDDTHPLNDLDSAANSIDIRRTPAEILQYVHLRTNSALVELNDIVARADRLGIISNVGGGGPHLHFAVLDRIDGAYLTRPAYFVSYCVSNDFGVTWEFIEAGMPTNGQWVRRANTERPAC